MELVPKGLSIDALVSALRADLHQEAEYDSVEGRVVEVPFEAKLDEILAGQRSFSGPEVYVDLPVGGFQNDFS